MFYCSDVDCGSRPLQLDSHSDALMLGYELAFAVTIKVTLLIYHTDQQYCQYYVQTGEWSDCPYVPFTF